MDTMIELPAMRRSAELAPNTADADSRTVEVVWSAGARVRRATFFGEPYDEELSLDPDHVRLDRLNAGAPFLKVHELDTLDAVIGSVVPGSARIENGRGIALVRISERADVEPIWRDIQAGHIRAVSIGYQVHRFEVSKPEAARELGTEDATVLTLRINYASALISEGRSRDDLVEAVALLEELSSTARRVFGTAHPTMMTINGNLESARSKLASFAAAP